MVLGGDGGGGEVGVADTVNGEGLTMKDERLTKSYSSVCFAATSPILGEELNTRHFNSPPKIGGVARRGERV